MRSYWSDILGRRLSRRRGLALTSATAGAALLAACGSSGSSGGTAGSAPGSSSSGDKSGLITPLADTTDRAKAGGTNKFYITSEPASFDVNIAIAPLEVPQGHVYSSLVQNKPGHLEPTQYDVMPDLAESWEWAADGLTLTMKLRQGVKWHNIAPVNGRPFDADDVVFSWNRYAKQASNRAQLANSASSDAPVLSIAAPDPRTVVFKLKYPVVYMLSILANYLSGNVIIFPREGDSQFDIKGQMIGTGPFMLAPNDYKPSVGFTFRRNPDYYEKGRPFVDVVEMPIILEYAQRLAQLKAGNLYAADVRAEDVVQAKKDLPLLNLYQAPLTSASQHWIFGWLPAGKSPFLDERVRQAVSLAIDRDLFIETFYNVSKFKDQGLPIQTSWNSAIPNTYAGWWLDPQGKDFGPTAKYFQYDVAQAKQLMSAAGHANGLDIVSHIAVNGYTDTYRQQVQVLEGMVADAGFRTTKDSVDYVSEFQPKYRDSKGNYEGWAHRSTAGGTQDPLIQEFIYATRGGIQFLGMNDGAGDPSVEAQIARASGETDTEKRKAIVQDLQRYLAGKMYAVIWPGGATGFSVAWPALQNFNVLQGGKNASQSNNSAWWIDDTQPPLKRA